MRASVVAGSGAYGARAVAVVVVALLSGHCSAGMTIAEHPTYRACLAAPTRCKVCEPPVLTVCVRECLCAPMLTPR